MVSHEPHERIGIFASQIQKYNQRSRFSITGKTLEQKFAVVIFVQIQFWVSFPL